MGQIDVIRALSCPIEVFPAATTFWLTVSDVTESILLDLQHAILMNPPRAVEESLVRYWPSSLSRTLGVVEHLF